MKILFVISKYYPKVGGTPNCVRNIVRYLSKEHDVEILTTMDGIDDNHVTLIDEVTVHKCISYMHIAMNDLMSNKKVPIYVLLKSLISKIVFRFIPIEPYFLKERYRRTIFRLNKNKKYDWIVAVGGDIIPAKAVDRCKGLAKTCFYQLDPYTTNSTLSPKSIKTRLKFEKKIHDSFDLIVTTETIKNEMKNFFKIGANVAICNFPNIANRVKPVVVPDEIRCMFCGSMYSARSASKMLNIINKVTKNNKHIFFDFYIIGDTSAFRDIVNENPNVVLFDPVDPDEIFDIMNEHQALVNIGNIMKNQVPSKIYDYISTGLPIVNFCNNIDCPTVDILESYPSSINILPEDDVYDSVQKLTDFLLNCAGHRVDYEVINKNFCENTIEYVAEHIVNKMQQIGDKSC